MSGRVGVHESLMELMGLLPKVNFLDVSAEVQEMMFITFFKLGYSETGRREGRKAGSLYSLQRRRQVEGTTFSTEEEPAPSLPLVCAAEEMVSLSLFVFIAFFLFRRL